MVTQDAYVSIRGARTRIHGEASRPEPVVFIDVDSDRFVEPLRNLPPTLLRQHHATLLIRLSDVTCCGKEQIQDLRKLIDSWGLRPRVAVLSHPIGRRADVEVISGDPLEDDEIPPLLAAARAVELEGLLEFGRAIWRPTHYHYRLTSGEHCGTYIKLGDAIREPRDAEALATWFAPYLGDRTGLVLDSGTLTPIAQAIEILMRRSGLELGAVSTLDQYPRAGVDVDGAFNQAAGMDEPVLAILAVSSSGILLGRVMNAIDRKAGSLSSARIVIMIDKSGLHYSEGGDGEDAALGETIAWTPIPGQPALAELGTDQPDDCELCRDPTRARLIPINPFTFDGMLPAQFRQIVPSISDPNKNRGLWEAAQRCGAVAVEARPHDALWRYRPERLPMSVVIRMQHLLEDEEFRGDLCDLIRKRKKDDRLRGEADLVLVPEHEMAYEGFEQFWAAIAPAFGEDMPEPVPFPPHKGFDADLVEQVNAAARTLVFALGTVTGGSLQHALLGVQTSRGKSSGAKLEAFVVHARPATYREWSTLRNSFGVDGKQHQLHHGWLSVLPDRSPLREEQVLLKSLDSDKLGSDSARQFLEDRLKLTGGAYGGDRAAVLWGSTPESHLTPDSIYGEHLDGLSTYVAVGSAITAGRRAGDERAAPELRVFDVAAVSRSYYDPLILGSFFRWFRPHETWWGWAPSDGETTVKHMIERSAGSSSSAEPRWVLIPELLLATAQGKVIRPAAEVVMAAADRLLEQELPEHVAAALEVGLELAPLGERQDP